MGKNFSVRALTLCHAAMGALLGFIAGLIIVIWTMLGGRIFLSGAMLEGYTVLMLLLCLASWTAVGAGISAYILISVERANRPLPR